MSDWKPWGSFEYEKAFYEVMVDGVARVCWPNAGGLHFASGKEGWVPPEKANGCLARLATASVAESRFARKDESS